MGLSDITAESVVRAIDERDRLGETRFRTTYGFGPARRYVLVHAGRTYDSKAIVGVAHGYATGTFWRAEDFSGGVASVVRTLQRLGFDARDMRGLQQPSARAIYGEVPGFPEGSTFSSRVDARNARVHRPGQAGICGTGRFGAESIVVSGGYEDDDDFGDVIFYTGHGGRDTGGHQVRDQTFDDPGNAALLTSSLTGEPVRVIRGAHRGSTHAPDSGYRYDGLFRVVRAWQQPGHSGHQVCRYELVKITREPSDPADLIEDEAAPKGNATPARRTTTTQRVVRSTAVALHVKRLHDDTCQACRTRLTIAGRGYSEGAHIRPLGRPHNGPDNAANVLCLCPNCHVLFDNGALIVDDDFDVWINGNRRDRLTTDDRHMIDREHIAYHREHYGGVQAQEPSASPP